MYKYAEPIQWKKPLKIAVAVTMALATGVLVCLALLTAKTPTITNTFTLKKIQAPIDLTVTEKIEGTGVTNIQIQNNSDTKAYIRAKIVATWQDTNGNVLAQVPTQGNNKDYEISINEGDVDGAWRKGLDGFYYHPTPVGPNTQTPGSGITYTLIDSCTLIKKPDTVPAGYDLHVTVLAQAIAAAQLQEYRSNGTGGTPNWANNPWYSGGSGVTGMDDNKLTVAPAST